MKIKKVIIGVTIGIIAAILWSVVFINSLNSMAGIGIGICLGISFGISGSLIFSKIDKDKWWYNFKFGELRKSEIVEESNLLVLNKLERLLTVCKVKNIDDIDLSKEFYFIGKTDEEISLVCETNDVPENTIEREDGWRGFRIQGILDFSLIGILSKLSGILADNKIGIFAVSTFNTDYILVKDADFEKSLAVLLNAGYTVI